MVNKEENIIMRIMKQLLIVVGFVLFVGGSLAEIAYSAENQAFFKRVEGKIGHQSPPAESVTPENEGNKKDILVVDTSRFPERTSRPLNAGVNLPKTGSILSNWIKYVGVILMLISILLLFSKRDSDAIKK